MMKIINKLSNLDLLGEVGRENRLGYFRSFNLSRRVLMEWVIELLLAFILGID
jgi:hypothetical protein